MKTLLTRKWDDVGSSETSVRFDLNARRYILHDGHSRF